MNEEELKQALATLEVFRAQSESLAEQQNLVQFSLEEYNRAKDTLSKWKEADLDAEILVPVGGNSFVHAKVAANDKALVGIGSGITVEKPLEEAIKIFDKRIGELTEGLKKISESLAVLESRSANLTQMVQAEYDKLQQKGARR